MNKTTIIKLFAGVAVAVFAATTMAQTTTVTGGAQPGKAGVARTVKATATVVSVDKATRDITLKGPQGNEITVTAGPDVKNFDAIKVGDAVNVTYKEALVLELKKGGGMAVARTETAGAAGAKPGATPAGIVGRQVTVVANVVALDAAKQIVTLKGPQRTVEMAVSDPEQFKRIAVGDQVEATYTQAFAMVVEPVKK